MGTLADRRDTKRVILDSAFAIAFSLKGYAYQEVRITNISMGGCFALVGARDARLFMRGAVLENLVLLHPELPKEPITAVVSYVLGGRPGQETMEMVGVGIQFLNMDDAAQGALAAWIDAAAITA
ncbi:MAG TPA: PilZ domain-containing protein [Geothrix sp.]|nr:PilZ domain-containing protein [Geothrix sp.]